MASLLGRQGTQHLITSVPLNVVLRLESPGQVQVHCMPLS
jgi:hypothetical protein